MQVVLKALQQREEKKIQETRQKHRGQLTCEISNHLFNSGLKST